MIQYLHTINLYVYLPQEANWMDKKKTKKTAAAQPAMRKEHDSMGEILVPADHYWGAQTQRSYQNFRIGTEKMPHEVIEAFAPRLRPTAN